MIGGNTSLMYKSSSGSSSFGALGLGAALDFASTLVSRASIFSRRASIRISNALRRLLSSLGAEAVFEVSWLVLFEGLFGFRWLLAGGILEPALLQFTIRLKGLSCSVHQPSERSEQLVLAFVHDSTLGALL